MDALLLALIACMAGEMGDRSQLLSMMLGIRYRQKGWLILGLCMAAAVNATLSAYAALLIVETMSVDARHLFMALAFLIGGVTMWLPTRAPSRLAQWRIGPGFSSFFGLLIIGFGEGAQFLIMGISVARGDPAFAAAGGTLGIIIACLPAMLMGAAFFTRLPVRIIRLCAASMFLIIGGVVAVNALGIA
jgi:Ca2+/H+ antiporter, TMEM165/GDT1 family